MNQRSQHTSTPSPALQRQVEGGVPAIKMITKQQTPGEQELALRTSGVSCWLVGTDDASNPNPLLAHRFRDGLVCTESFESFIPPRADKPSVGSETLTRRGGGERAFTCDLCTPCARQPSEMQGGLTRGSGRMIRPHRLCDKTAPRTTRDMSCCVGVSILTHGLCKYRRGAVTFDSSLHRSDVRAGERQRHGIPI